MLTLEIVHQTSLSFYQEEITHCCLIIKSTFWLNIFALCTQWDLLLLPLHFLFNPCCVELNLGSITIYIFVVLCKYHLFFHVMFQSENGTIKFHILVGDIALTHWGRVTHICVSQLITIVSDNGLSPDRRQAIIWNNDGILLFGPVESKFSEILIKMYTFSFKKMHLKI